MRFDASIRLLVGLVGYFLGGCGVRAADTPTVERLEATALASRQQIRTISARITAEVRRGNRSENKVWRLWWEGPERMRGDLTRDHLPPEGVRIIHAVGVERPGWSLFFEDRKNVCAPFHKKSGADDNSLFAVVDPRYFGYTNDYTGSYNGLANSVLGRTDRTNLTVEETVYGGQRCHLIRWKSKSNVDSQAIINPQQGGNPVRFEGNYSFPDGTKLRKVREVCEIELTQHGAGKIWYPNTIKYEQKFDDDIKTAEVAKFDQVTINEPIPPQVFTLKGLGLQEGQILCLPAGDPLGPVAVWKDGRLQRRPDDRASKFDTAEPVPVGNGGGGVNVWLVVACVGCSLAAVALLVFRSRSKKE